MKKVTILHYFNWFSHSSLCLAFLFFLGNYKLNAQTIIAPIYSDNTLATGFSPGFTVNNATIDYNWSAINYQLLATEFYDGSTTTNLIVKDGTGTTITTAVTPPSFPGYYTWAYGSDVILGGSNLFRSTVFYAAVVYTVQKTSQTYPYPSTFDFYISVFEIDNPSNGMTVTAVCNGIQISHTGTASHCTGRIDGIAKDGHHPGEIVCDNFVMTYYDDIASCSGQSSLYAIYCPGGLSYIANNCALPPGTLTQTVSDCTIPGLHSVGGDVAGIERTVGSNIDDIALITTDIPNPGSPSTSSAIYYQEWDMTTNTLGSPVLVDNNGGNYSYPYIDAIDYHSENDPANGYANFDIVYTDDSPGAVMSYNNLNSGPISPVSCTKYQQAVVACGPGQLYSIVYTYLPGWPWCMDGAIYSQTIDWSTGSLSNSDILRVSYDYVNSPTIGTSIGDWNGILDNSVAGVCNQTIPDYVYTAWEDDNHFTILASINYKTTGNPVVYKPAAISNINKDNKWRISPNPATDHLIISSTNNDLNGFSYSINDITGRVVLQSTITSNSQLVTLPDIAPGIYTLNIYSNQLIIMTEKILKE